MRIVGLVDNNRLKLVIVLIELFYGMEEVACFLLLVSEEVV